MSGTPAQEMSINDSLKLIESKVHDLSRLTWAVSELAFEKNNTTISDVEWMGRVACLSTIAFRLAEEADDLLYELCSRIKDNAGATR